MRLPHLVVLLELPYEERAAPGPVRDHPLVYVVRLARAPVPHHQPPVGEGFARILSPGGTYGVVRPVVDFPALAVVFDAAGGGDGEEFGHVVFDHFFIFFEEVGCGVTVGVGAIVRGGRAGVGGGVDFSGHVHTPHTHYFSNQRLQSSYLFVVSTVAFLI